MRGRLADELAAFAAEAGGGAQSQLLADRPDGTVARGGDIVAKAHAPDSDLSGLTARLLTAAHPLLDGILLAPLPVPLPVPRSPGPPQRGMSALATSLHDRTVTLWPFGEPVAPEDPDAAPWEEVATLLARLHAVPTEELAAELPAPLPPMRGPAKAARAIARMRSAAPGAAAADVVLRAWARLPVWARDEAAPPASGTLCHGDLHLGQLVRHPAPAGPWVLIDIDDLGLGCPAWDLARPAGWYAAGLLDPEVWERFLGAYRAAGGSAVRPDGDPWPELDVPARALTVQTAALAVTKSAEGQRPLDEVEELMIEACSRIAALPPELEFEAAS